MLPICVKTERVWPKLSSIQDIRANLVYIVSLKIVYGPFWQSTMHLISAPDQPGSKRMYHYPVRAYCSNIYIYRGSKDVVWYFIYSFNKKETT